MICPHCHSEGFKPYDGFPLPLKIVGTEKYDKFNYRRYICVQCGYKFLSVEKFERPVINDNEQFNLFEDTTSD